LKITEFFKIRFRYIKFDFYILLELIIISIIIVSSNYLFDKKLFFFNKSFDYYYIVIMIIGLYYGLASGFVLTFILSLIGYLIYFNFPFYFFIHGILISLIAGEFNFYFKINLSKLEAEVDFLKNKLREIGKTFLFTKLSHDNLEKSYFIKPYTLRSIVLELANKNSYEEFLTFIANQFHIISFALVEKDKIFKYNIEKVDLNDELIQKMYAKKELYYISQTKNKNSYLATIPIMISDNIDAFIVIQDMSFIHFNIENLLAIQFASEFFYLNKKKNLMIQNIQNNPLCKYISCEKVVELNNLINLYKITHAPSIIMLFDIEKYNSETFENFLIKNLRSLDFFEKIDLKTYNLFIVVLPFTSKEGGFFFIQRVLEMLKYVNLHNSYQIYELNSLKKIEFLIKDRNEN